MAGIAILTSLDAEAALKLTRKVGKQLGFSVREVDDWKLALQKGNLVLSFFVGAFVAYCDFRVLLSSGRDNSTEIEIQRNSPWWTGLIGVSRVKSKCKELADHLEDAIEDQDGKVLKRTNV